MPVTKAIPAIILFSTTLYGGNIFADGNELRQNRSKLPAVAKLQQQAETFALTCMNTARFSQNLTVHPSQRSASELSEILWNGLADELGLKERRGSDQRRQHLYSFNATSHFDDAARLDLKRDAFSGKYVRTARCAALANRLENSGSVLVAQAANPSKRTFALAFAVSKVIGSQTYTMHLVSRAEAIDPPTLAFDFAIDFSNSDYNTIGASGDRQLVKMLKLSDKNIQRGKVGKQNNAYREFPGLWQHRQLVQMAKARRALIQGDGFYRRALYNADELVVFDWSIAEVTDVNGKEHTIVSLSDRDDGNFAVVFEKSFHQNFGISLSKLIRLDVLEKQNAKLRLIEPWMLKGFFSLLSSIRYHLPRDLGTAKKQINLVHYTTPTDSESVQDPK